MKYTKMIAFYSSLAASAVWLSGCASSGVRNPSGVPVTEMRPDERGFVAGTGVESQDIVAASDKMARGILAVPQIANAKTRPYVVLDPIVNETRFVINKDIFLTRIMTRLTAQAQGRVGFLARDRMAALQHERELKQAGQVVANSNPDVIEFKGADFFLTGKLQGQSTHTSRGTSDYVYMSFQLIDARTSEVIWADEYEIKKQGLEDAAYR